MEDISENKLHPSHLWKKMNPDRVKVQNKKYYDSHREAILANKKRYYQEVIKPMRLAKKQNP